jgi:ribonuclease BN (tRNA processing enzyme)
MHADHLRTTIGARMQKDLSVLDARLTPSTDDPWFMPPSATTGPVSKIGSQVRSADSIAPSTWVLRNVGGYNALAVDLGRCWAVIDAAASFRISALPGQEPEPAAAATAILEILNQLRPGHPVCYVVPTHHHADHFGGIPTFAQRGATVVTSPQNAELVSRIIRPSGPETSGHRQPSVRVVKDSLVLGDGERRVEIHLLRNDPHVAEMLFAYLPASRIVFEADISDYVLSARTFLRTIEERHMAVDRIYGAHNSGVAVPEELADDEPVN